MRILQALRSRRQASSGPHEDPLQAYLQALADHPEAQAAFHLLRSLSEWECRPYVSGSVLTATIRPRTGWLSAAPGNFQPLEFVAFVRKTRGVDVVSALTRRLERGLGMGGVFEPTEGAAGASPDEEPAPPAS
jgi:hypothetical protein